MENDITGLMSRFLHRNGLQRNAKTPLRMSVRATLMTWSASIPELPKIFEGLFRSDAFFTIEDRMGEYVSKADLAHQYREGKEGKIS